MRFTHAELHRVRLPLRRPYRTSFGVIAVRELTMLRVAGPDGEGWGECCALPEPSYSHEFLDAADDVIQRWLLPSVLDDASVRADGLAARWSWIHGHRMAKSAVEMAVLDAELRARGEGVSKLFGATRDRVACGGAIGILDSIPELLDAVDVLVETGHPRVKLKIQPGWDLAPVAAVRDRHPDLVLQVDANAAYDESDVDHLAQLDEFELLLIEEPLSGERLPACMRLRERLTTPVCLDETITSLSVCQDAIDLRAVDVVNIKPCRVGGYLEALRIRDLCAEHGIGIWVGGVFETALGLAANIALGANAAFDIIGDLVGSHTYFEDNVTFQPIEMVDGHVDVPTGLGMGVEVDASAVAAVAVSSRTIA